MKNKIFRTVLIAALLILLILTNMPFTGRNSAKAFTLPALPRPISNAPFAITSAGQSTDTYIIRDISNQLMLSSYFMPQAKEADMKDVDAIVFVVGYSPLGMKLQNTSYSEELARVTKLVKEAEENDLKVITVVIGGCQSPDSETEELVRLIGSRTDYIIGLRESNTENILIELARERDIPLTLVSTVKDISEPFASAFR